MQTTYGNRRRKSVQTGRKSGKKEREGRQLVQLLLCVAVFLAVFLGKGVWPCDVARTGDQLLDVIRSNTDFHAAFASLGRSLSQQESVLGELGDFCVSVFAPEQQGDPELSTAAASVWEQEASGALQPEQGASETEPALRVGDVVQLTSGQEAELPEGYSAQWLFLGDLETTTPVMGTVTSAFGYREHPTMGHYAAHGGVDIAADQGASIGAFAGGIVSDTGESDDFGLYLQIDHEHGVSTFYSHCSKLCVQKGERVAVGQTVAEVGSTGQSTGPHLHFEVRLNGVRLNPMYYIAPGQEV